MLVIISDLHLTDGTTCTNISADAFALLGERLRDLAHRASWRADGAYRPIEQIDLLLLGDIFDHLHSTRWDETFPSQAGLVRPWDDFKNPAFVQKIATITEGILARNADAFSSLRALSAEGVVIPVKPSFRPLSKYTGKGSSVPVRIFYMSGNHDWYFHLPGAAYNDIRRNVVKTMGLLNPPSRFPHDISEWGELEKTCLAHSVLARHGDLHDSINFDKTKGRDASALGDAIATELIDRFPSAVEDELGKELSPSFFADLREIVNVRPALFAAAWIEGLTRRWCPDPQQAGRVKEIWNEFVDAFLKNPFVRSYDKPFAFDHVNAFDLVLRLTKKASMEFISNLFDIVTEKFLSGDVSLSYAKYAIEEKAFQERAARYIVFGHTHYHEIKPLDSYDAQGEHHHQICFNSGTWHSVHTPTKQGRRNFVGHHVLTYLVFFKDDERRGRPYESWSGTLAWE